MSTQTIELRIFIIYYSYKYNMSKNIEEFY